MGSIFWKTPDIGLASFSIIPLRVRLYLETVSLEKKKKVVSTVETRGLPGKFTKAVSGREGDGRTRREGRKL